MERRPACWALAFVVLASVRIVSTYPVFNHTMDEPAHIACGMEWLDKGAYEWEPQHPPLARVAAALPLYLAGVRSENTPRDLPLAMSLEGAAILYSGHQYDRNLALARLGILPFFWAACAVVYAWGLRYFRPGVAVAGVFVFSMLPPVMAHAGLATTDMALTAAFGATFLAFLIWLDEPNLRHAVWLGLAGGLMMLSKFSGLAFFPVSAALALAWRRRAARREPSRKASASFVLAILTGALVVWAGYRFSFGDAGFWHLRLPAPELYAGIRQVLDHNALGHVSYLMGVRSQAGFWWFFPVALAVKSPLAFLILVLVSVAFLIWNGSFDRNAWALVAFSAGVLLVGIFSHIDIGVRHVLPAYLGLALLAGVGLVRLLEWSDSRLWLKASIAFLMLWLAGSSLWSHPDYLAYFNELAGNQPEKILVDSDLDWGQDLKRLSARLHQAGAAEVAFDPYVPGGVEQQLGFPPIHPLNASGGGWNAIGLTAWKKSVSGRPPGFITPPERVGKSILLWYVPPFRAAGAE
jgi:hypothetical protein